MTAQVLDRPLHEMRTSAGPENSTSFWGGVFAMTLCIFALIASEFMPVSVLTPLARDLHISEGLAGYGIAISGVFAVLTSLSISTLAGQMNRKTLLLMMTGLMCVSGLIIGFAVNYAMYMIGRALIGVVVGGFWSMSAAVAMRLVPPQSVPKALAIFNGGNALATVVAAPLGSYLSVLIGWRGAFFCLVPVALITLVWQWISLPPLKADRGPRGSSNIFTLLKSPLVCWGMAAVGVFFMGQFVLFTYVRPFLENVTGVQARTLSMMLLILGIAGLIGTVFIGRFLKANIYRTLIAIPLIMALIAMGLIALGSSAAAVAVLLGLWGLFATAAPVGWWLWLARALPNNAEAGGGLMVAVIQLCIASGSTIGGTLFDAAGYRITFIVSAALLFAAGTMALVTARAHTTQRV